MTKYEEAAVWSVDRHREEYIETAKLLWDHPELRFKEQYACDLMTGELKKEGFRVERGAGGLPTAFRAVYGSGKPVIGFLGEYDALPNLSQEAGVAEQKRRMADSDPAGHGCGHHMLGTGLLGAAVALKEYLSSEGKEGTVIFYGCPAEEGGSGKVWMLRSGVFDEADVLFTWHPDCINRVSPNDVLATVVKEYYFHGTASHAGASPESGRSALEAAELMAVGMGFLREHLPQTARVHYAYLNAGGSATNVIQPEAGVAYQIRSPRASEAMQIADRIDDLARGAAIMTGTRAEISFQRATSELRVNETVNDVLYDALSGIGRPEADESSLTFANKLYETLPNDARGSTALKAEGFYGHAKGRELAAEFSGSPLIAEIYPRSVKSVVYGVSTDVGDVSMCKPVGYLNVACFVKDTSLHSWQAVAFGKTGFAMDGMLTAARVIGAAAIRLASEPELVAAAKEEWERQNGEEPYVSPTPPDAEPKFI